MELALVPPTAPAFDNNSMLSSTTPAPSDGADLNLTLAIVRDTFQPVIEALQLALLNATRAQGGLLEISTEVMAITEAAVGRSLGDSESSRPSEFSDEMSSSTLAPLVMGNRSDQLAASLASAGCLGQVDSVGGPLSSAQQLIHDWLAAEKAKLFHEIIANGDHSSETNATAPSAVTTDAAFLNASTAAATAAGRNATAGAAFHSAAAVSELEQRLGRLFDQLENVTALSLAKAFRDHQATLDGKSLVLAGSSSIAAPAHSSPPPAVVVLNVNALVLASAEYFTFLNDSVRQGGGSGVNE